MQQAAAKNAMAFKTKCLDVNFDLENSEYRAIQNIGTGAYGVVCSAVNKKNSEKVAIKKIPNAFEELTTAKRTYRELKIMRHFRHENVIGIREILMPREPLNDFKDVYVVLDLMESDLHQIIHSQQSVSMEHIRYFLYQILRGLKYIHSANVVHRDLKPSNLLVNENCELKIGDFGMARGLSCNVDSKRKMFMTVYVATRWYRAPELLFSNDDYSYAIDMWSVGCIFAEMLGRRQIFPGRNPMHQLTLIIEVLGMPPDKLLRSSNSDQIFNFFHRNFGGRKCVNLREKYPKVDDNGLDLLSKMLIFNPEDRISVTDALSHPFLSKYHDPDDEPNCYPVFDFSFEQDDLNAQQMRQNVGKMILKYQRTKLFAGKKFPSSSPILKPSTAVTVTSAARQDTKETTAQTVAASIHPAKILPTTDREKHIPNSETKSSPQEVVFKVPSRPVDEKKVVVSESNSDKDSLSTVETLTVVAMPSLTVTDDVDMKSARSSAQNSAITKTQELSGSASTLEHLTAPSISRSSGDVEMKSAHGEPKQPLTESSIGPSNTGSSQSLDIDMKSARGQQEETGSVADSSRITAPVEESVGKPVEQSLGSENAGQKTISDDTKKLIKAALLNSALKNKMRKDSEGEKGGGKMPITALARQREREQKRRQKLRRSQERQKKGKGKGKKNAHNDDEAKSVLLTEEDRSMLERWNKMQGKTKEQEYDAMKAPHSIEEPSLVVTEPGKDSQNNTLPNHVDSNNAGSSVGAFQSAQLPQAVEPLSNAVSQLCEEQDVAQSETVSKGDILSQRKMDTNSLLPQQQNTHSVSSYSDTLPSSSFSLPPSSQGQRHQQTSYKMTSLAGSENFNVGGTTPFFSQSIACNPTQVLYTGSEGNNSNNVNTRDQPHSSAVDALTSKSSMSTINNISTARFLGGCPPAMTSPSFDSQAGRMDSSFQQYRSRHYSDRETPSPPHNIQQSPPAYEDAMKAKYTTSYTSPTGSQTSYPYKHNTQYLSNSRQSLMAQALPPNARTTTASPPELAHVIHQLSKSAMEDSLPPILQVTPKGNGTGYGLSLDIEDWLEENSLGSPRGASKLDSSGPLSASLLSDWLEVRDMNVDDMMAVQQELGLTSPFNLSDIPGLAESPKNKDRV